MSSGLKQKKTSAAMAVWWMRGKGDISGLVSPQWSLSNSNVVNGGCYQVQCSTVQCSTVQYKILCSTVQCNTVQCSTVQCSTVQYSQVQYSALHVMVEQCSAL